MYRFIIILILIIGCSQKQSNDYLKKGTFELYENEKFIAKIYRLNNYQIEEYEDSIVVARLEWLSDNSFIIKSTKKNQIDMDTVTFAINHYKVSENEFKIIGKSYNVKLDYTYGATLKKKDSEVLYFKDTLISLNKNQKK
ncbi:hypothetical protein [Kordia sp.]|uniref:hypothetical protein n=1 Tax=Kordia sp. TaxID=1965332 RepID=UPI003B592C36